MSTSTHPDHVQRAVAEPVTIDAVGTINEYLSRADWRVNANANQGYSLGGMILNTSGKVIANYWLTQVYGEAADKAHRNGDLHIHDLDMFAGYCAGWSLRMLLEQGFNGVPGAIAAAASALLLRGGADRQLPRHAAERVGRRAGVLLLRHLHGPVRPAR